MNVADFDFDLPESLVAQEARPRGESRLMIVDRTAATWREAHIRDLPSVLTLGDLIVVNDTRVFPARLLGRRDPSGGAVECLLVDRVDDRHWHALVHPGQKLKAGAEIVFEDAARAPGVRLRATVLERLFFGRRLIDLRVEGRTPADLALGTAVDAAIDALGHVPLPPYIHRADREDDRARYQTIFAQARGSIAAPTAGLHFDDALVAALAAHGVERTAITLHVGYGTFKPIRVEDLDVHVVDPETYEIRAAAAEAVRAARSRGRRVVAVGTTTTRALESAGGDDRLVRPGRGTAELFIRPGYDFRVVDALVTNFHLPRSSLFALVAAFVGRELLLAAYRDAIARQFQFYSYGDAMVVV
jgi:S-adenosylmethionine:tRNA ribosyltransferase-isomerase